MSININYFISNTHNNIKQYSQSTKEYLHRYIDSFSLKQTGSKLTNCAKKTFSHLPAVERKTKLVAGGVVLSGLIPATVITIDQAFNDGEYCAHVTELLHNRLDSTVQMVASLLQEPNTSNPYALIPYTESGNIYIPSRA